MRDKKSLIMVFVFLIVLSAGVLAQETSQTQTTETQQTKLPSYFLASYGEDPTTVNPWMQEYCNKSGMDFIVMTMPDACEPALVRSDILEDENVPVFCRLTAVKINPLIQVPYIKRIDVITENKSPEILDVAFFPARAALSYYDYRAGLQTEELKGFPSMNNLGYLMIRLKKQPVEGKMPESVAVNLTTKITYDVSKTFGINEHQFVLKKMTDAEWQENYKKYSFWNGKGYLRLIELEGPNKAKIALYTSATGRPFWQGTLSVGEKSQPIKLPYFYCEVGPQIQLDKISKPETRARLLVNGNELLLSEDSKILDSGCSLEKIDPSNYSYAGRVTIRCMGQPQVLTVDEVQAELSVKDQIQKYSIGSEILLDGKYWYIGFIDRKYDESETETAKVTNFVVMYGGKDQQVPRQTKEKISGIIQDIEMKKREEGYSIATMSGSSLKNEIISKNKKVENSIGDVEIIKGDTKPIPGITLVRVLGLIDAKYHQEVETAYKEAIKEYKNVAYAYGLYEHPEGSYYGIVSYKKAAELASFFDKKEEERKLLLQLIDKYGDSDNEKITREIEAIRSQLARLSAGGGKSSTVLVTQQGNYLVQLISVERPGYETLVAHLEVNGTPEDVVLDDTLDSWYVNSIDETSVKFRHMATGAERTISSGSMEYLNETKVKVLRTEVNFEATATILPFESNRETEANFSVSIGIEKRAIQLSPSKIKSLIESLNKTIETMNKIKDALGKTTSTWKKACYIGGTALWLRNFVIGLGGKTYARRKVMEKWKLFCGSESYRKTLGTEISVARCYQMKEQEINKDIEIYNDALTKTNTYINAIKKREGVTSKGLFGLTQYIDEDEFMKAVNIPQDLRGMIVSDLKGEKNISVDEIFSKINILYEDGKIYRGQLNSIVLDFYVLKKCESETEEIFLKSALCNETKIKTFVNLEPLYEAARGPTRQELSKSPLLQGIQGFDSPYASKTLGTISQESMPVYGPHEIKKADGTPCDRGYYTIAKTSKGTTLLMLEDTGNQYYKIVRAYTFEKNGNWSVNCVDVLADLNLSNYFIVPVDPRSCGNNNIKDPEIKFWESGQYQGMPALMPVIPQSGWYFATESYTGFENELVAYRGTGDPNSFWICNVGPDGKVDFNFLEGPQGDDAGCCRKFSATGALESLPSMDAKGTKDMIERTKECLRKAKTEYDQGKKKINTGKCGTYRLGKSPAAVPTLECEDFMSPSECKILYNLCDPVICPASRCNFGGRYNTENVIREGIIGSIFLCLPNYKEGILVPVCISGLYQGVDDFTKFILENYRNCLQEQLATGKTIGICDEAHSIYVCDFLWGHLAPLLKYGIPQITSPLRGGGEYASFSESWKNMIESLDYFTQVYAPKTIQAFKERATNQAGKEVCKKFISVVYPSPGKFLDELSKPNLFANAWATKQEVRIQGPTPESHYKVHYTIKAGDQPLIYSVFLRNPPTGGFYEVPQQYFIPNATGFLQAGQVVDATPDFFASSGYQELCIRLNAEEKCDFSTVSWNFALEELENLYLKNQLKQEVTTAKECEQGTPSIVPVASLNLQNVLEEGISPTLYKHGVSRICQSTNPGEAIGEKERFQRIGYCGNPEIGCWLDLNSLNRTISDLKIRQDIIDYSKEKDMTYAINKLGLDTLEITKEKIRPIEEEIIKLREKVTEFDGRLNALESRQEKEQESEIEKIENEIEPYVEKISQLQINTTSIINKAYDSNMKARAEYRLAELTDLKARLIGLIPVWEWRQTKEKTTCENQGGEWFDNNCPEGKVAVEGYDTFSDFKQGKICCKDKSAEEKQFSQWFTDSYKIASYYENTKEVFVDGTKAYALGNGQVVEIKTSTLPSTITYITQYSDNIFVEYKMSGLSSSGRIKKIGRVNTGDVMAEIHIYYPESLLVSIYISDDANLEARERRNPLCFFTSDIIKKVEEANSDLIEQGELRIPSEEECSEILSGVSELYEGNPVLFLEWPLDDGKIVTYFQQETVTTEGTLRRKILEEARSLEGKKYDNCWEAMKAIYEKAGANWRCVYSDPSINPATSKPDCGKQIDPINGLEPGDLLQIYNENAYTGEHNLIFVGWEKREEQKAIVWHQPTPSRGITRETTNLKESTITIIWKPATAKVTSTSGVATLESRTLPAQNVYLTTFSVGYGGGAFSAYGGRKTEYYVAMRWPYKNEDEKRWWYQKKILIQANGKKCIGVVEDFGPDESIINNAKTGCWQGAESVIDVSPKIAAYLFNTEKVGWSDCKKVYVSFAVDQRTESGCFT